MPLWLRVAVCQGMQALNRGHRSVQAPTPFLRLWQACSVTYPPEPLGIRPELPSVGSPSASLPDPASLCPSQSLLGVLLVTSLEHEYLTQEPSLGWVFGVLGAQVKASILQ